MTDESEFMDPSKDQFPIYSLASADRSEGIYGFVCISQPRLIGVRGYIYI